MIADYKIKKNVDIDYVSKTIVECAVGTAPENVDIDRVSKIIAECAVDTIPEVLGILYDINVDDLDRQAYHTMVAEILHKVNSMLLNVL